MPTIRQKQGGGLFVTVKTRRGPRARQIKQEGVAWLRQRLPENASLHDVLIDYEMYREMQQRGYIDYPWKRRDAGTSNVRPSGGRCPACGRVVPSGAQFCPHCGGPQGRPQPVSRAGCLSMMVVGIGIAVVVCLAHAFA